jgi:outer membrane lipoprotein-sorting protein
MFPYFIFGQDLDILVNMHGGYRKIILRSPIVLVFLALLSTSTVAWNGSELQDLLQRMEAAYEGVEDYQTHVEIKTRRPGGSFTTRRALYTFKKPHWIRLDFETPHSGTVLVYPDPTGKAAVRPAGWTRFFKLHLSPDNVLLRVAPGQRVDQTDLGLLIRNIFHSLTDRRHGKIEVAEDSGEIRIRVLSDDHFRQGVLTRYEFFVDRRLWLPTRVDESHPRGTLTRTVIFRDLKINIGIPDSFFQPDGG